LHRGEIFNSVTHLVGSIFALTGLALLVVLGVRSGDPWRLTGYAVYGVSLLLLYVFSTLYHAVSGPVKRVFRKLDHTSIYVLIAGTYTPFALVSLRGRGGMGLLVVIWTLAAGGIAQEFLLRRRVEALSVALYLLMGWLALTVVGPMSQTLGWPVMAWVFAGGLFYTTGVLFFFLDEKMAHSHGVFHLFTLAGSVIHYFVILWRVR
jgi:hemolysin III